MLWRQVVVQQSIPSFSYASLRQPFEEIPFVLRSIDRHMRESPPRFQCQAHRSEGLRVRSNQIDAGGIRTEVFAEFFWSKDDKCTFRQERQVQLPFPNPTRSGVHS